MQYRRKAVEFVTAITFDELVAHGKSFSTNIVNGMPWSFTYDGHPVTHENDNCYLITTPTGSVRFERGDLLVTNHKGEVSPWKLDVFNMIFEPVTEFPMTTDPLMEPDDDLPISDCDIAPEPGQPQKHDPDCRYYRDKCLYGGKLGCRCTACQFRRGGEHDEKG